MSEYETKFNWNGIPEPRVDVTLRDHMAMAALVIVSDLCGTAEEHARIAHEYADAMMRVRNE